jgi:hypothetical protein
MAIDNMGSRVHIIILFMGIKMFNQANKQLMEKKLLETHKYQGIVE